MTKRFLIFIALCAALAVPSLTSAQTSITTTTLSAAITATSASPTSFTITVASATGIAANGVLYVDGSVYRVLSVSGTTITVINQYFPASHLTSATVYVVPVGARIGKNPVGSCIRSTAGQFPAYSPYTLMFNLATGDVAACRGAVASSRIWVLTNPYSVGAASNNPPQTQ